MTPAQTRGRGRPKARREGQYSWEDFESRYRRPQGIGRQDEAEAFIAGIDPGTAQEYDIPDGIKEESARTVLYSAAKRIGVHIMITARFMPEGKLLVGVPPKE